MNFHSQLDKIISLDTVDSTNLALKRKRLDFQGMNVLLVSDEQTQGKGQKGRTWESARNKGLWMSLHLGRETILSQDLQLLSLYAGLCVWNVLSPLVKQAVELKWPNDILIGSKKVGGILTEVQWQGERIVSVILGIGINLSHTKQDFPESIRAFATSLSLEGTTSPGRDSLTKDLITIFFENFSQMNDGEGLAENWNRKAYLMNRHVEIETADGALEGVFSGINPKGEALIRIDGGLNTFQAGEIRLTGTSD